MSRDAMAFWGISTAMLKSSGISRVTCPYVIGPPKK